MQSLGTLPVKLRSFNVIAKNEIHEISWETATEQDVLHFEVEYSSDGINFKTIGVVPATNTNSHKVYTFKHNIPNSVKVFYRLKILDNDGHAEYSAFITLAGSNEFEVIIAPTLVKNKVNIYLKKPFKSLQVVDMNGRVLKIRSINQSTGIISIDVSDLFKGMYIIKIFGKDSEVHRKIVIQ